MILVAKALGRPRMKLVDNIKMDRRLMTVFGGRVEGLTSAVTFILFMQ
jgi:hypothetical protein